MIVKKIHFEVDNTIKARGIQKTILRKYKNYSPENIPDYIHLNLDLLERFEISSPIKTDNGYVLIYFYNHQEKIMPNLINSWNLIYNYTKLEINGKKNICWI